MIEVIATTESTNTLMRERAANGAPHASAVLAINQTAGRGQRGNAWEAEPGANATFSLLLRPAGIAARNQFVISQAAALAVVDTLQHCGLDAQVKWPNDIYVGDNKIAGILIENSLNGSSISSSIIGIGLNVNQVRFHSDAPNPISIKQLTGRDYDPVALADEICRQIVSTIAHEPHASIAERYFGRLWRRQGEHPYIDTATGKRFDGRIVDVAPDGILTLNDTTNGCIRKYFFKEVSFVL